MRRVALLLAVCGCWTAALPSAVALTRPQQEALVRGYAAHYGLRPELVAAFIDQESGWAAHALSDKGAMGLMQLIPATARRFGAYNPYDPDQNVAAGVRYLTTLMWQFHGDERLVAAAYYAGEHRIAGRRLDYSNPAVVTYVQSVRRHYLARKQFSIASQGSFR